MDDVDLLYREIMQCIVEEHMPDKPEVQTRLIGLLSEAMEAKERHIREKYSIPPNIIEDPEGEQWEGRQQETWKE